MAIRKLKSIHRALRDDIDDLMTRRPLPGPSLPDLNPFLFLNHHGPQVYPPRNNGLPFGPHPHRGFETVTFVLDGSLAHSDTGGHESVIDAGGVQWMTAGRGLVHAELSPLSFKERGGRLEILQLWLNLPAKLKMVPPRYVGLQAESIPVVQTPDGLGKVQLISGEWEGVTGPVNSLTGTFMSVAHLKPGATFRVQNLAGRVAFLYVARGEVAVAGDVVPSFHLAELHDGGETLDLQSIDESVVVFGHAQAINEPIAAHGPFVMNTRAELRQAFEDYQAGKFNVDAG